MKYRDLSKLTKKELLAMVVKENFGAVNNAGIAANFMAKFSGLIKNWSKEHFIIVCLNSKNEVIHSEILFIGTINSCVAHPREIFRTAIMADAVSVVVGHNHPSMDTTPSKEDMAFTDKLKQSGEIIGIPVLDSIVFNKLGEFRSI